MAEQASAASDQGLNSQTMMVPISRQVEVATSIATGRHAGPTAPPAASMPCGTAPMGLEVHAGTSLTLGRPQIVIRLPAGRQPIKDLVSRPAPISVTAGRALPSALAEPPSSSIQQASPALPMRQQASSDCVPGTAATNLPAAASRAAQGTATLMAMRSIGQAASVLPRGQQPACNPNSSPLFPNAPSADGTSSIGVAAQGPSDLHAGQASLPIHPMPAAPGPSSNKQTPSVTSTKATFPVSRRDKEAIPVRSHTWGPEHGQAAEGAVPIEFNEGPGKAPASASTPPHSADRQDFWHVHAGAACLNSPGSHVRLEWTRYVATAGKDRGTAACPDHLPTARI